MLKRGKNELKIVAFFVMLIVVVVILAVIVFSPPSQSSTFSFEDGMQDWGTSGTDLEIGEETLNWSIERSVEISTDGDASLKFYLDNMNDAGKIWIERRFDVNSDQEYRVKIEFDFATTDFGSVNLWRIIAGASHKSPETADDLMSSYRDSTGNGHDSDVGYQWLTKEYEFSASSSSQGELVVFVGVWGTWETPRTYFIDNLTVTLTG